MKRKAEDAAHAEELGVRDMVATIYSAMITAPATAFNKNPPPGLIDRVESIDNRLIKVEDSLGHRTMEGQVSETGHLTGDITSAPVP
jgi:hypothetical protein